MINLQSKQLVDAVRLWAGRGLSPMPSRDEGRVVQHFSKVDAAGLLATIKRLEDDFYASDAHLTAANLQEMESLASEAFRLKHPSADDEIVKTLAWCYTFDYK
jgi:hypothetical protein